MNPTNLPKKIKLDLLYTIDPLRKPSDHPNSPPPSPAPPVITENSDLLLMMSPNSPFLTLLLKSMPYIHTRHFDLTTLDGGFLIDDAVKVSNLTINENSRFFTILLENQALLLYSLTILSPDLNDCIIERIRPSFRLELFRCPLWKKHCLFFVDEAQILKIDPRTPFELIQPIIQQDFLRQPPRQESIASFAVFKEFEQKIVDFACSRVLELFYVVLEFSGVCVVNFESSVIMRAELPFAREPLGQSDICRVFPLLRIRRSDRPKRDNLKSYDFKMRDFLCFLRENGHIEIVKLNDLKNGENAPKLFQKSIFDKIDNGDSVKMVMDQKQEFVGVSLANKMIMFRLSDHFAGYNKKVHSKGRNLHKSKRQILK